jgi:predicted nucleic acid-binding protein
MGDCKVTLVDSSSWIEFLRGRQTEPALRVQHLLASGQAAWCDLIAVELWNGVRIGKERKALDELEVELSAFALDANVWKLARKLAFRCRQSGITAPSNDVIIAACAVTHDLGLEHCDKHFDDILPLAKSL